MAKVFVPSSECTVASGDCFVSGKCLARCVPNLPRGELANQELGKALRILKELKDFTIASRSCTYYVDGSSIHEYVKEAQSMLKKYG